jgi:hypothetical protein
MFIIVPAALSVTALMLSRGKLTPITLLILLQAQILAGSFLLDEQFGMSIGPLQAAALIALMIGYYTVERSRRLENVASDTLTSSDQSRAQLVIVGILAFVGYHFVVGGVPALSGTVETSRYAFAAAGLFGIPGRMFLYGLPFAALMSLSALLRQPSLASRRLAQVVWGAFVLSEVLGGFKGGIVTVILVALLGLALAGRPMDLSLAVRSRWLLAAFAAAVCVAVFYSFQYRSLGVNSPTDAARYLVARLTVDGARPGYVALTEIPSPTNPPYVVDDISYFAERYAGFRIMPYEPFPLDQKISARLYGIPLSRDSFLVPVTVGPYAGWAVDFGR